jgi:multidrug efflux pump subunit AcrB
MPDVNGDEFRIGFRVPPGSRIEYTLEKGREIASFMRKQPEVQFTYLSVGGGFRGTPNNGNVFVKLHPKADRKRSLCGHACQGGSVVHTPGGCRPLIGPCRWHCTVARQTRCL